MSNTVASPLNIVRDKEPRSGRLQQRVALQGGGNREPCRGGSGGKGLSPRWEPDGMETTLENSSSSCRDKQGPCNKLGSRSSPLRASATCSHSPAERVGPGDDFDDIPDEVALTQAAVWLTWREVRMSANGSLQERRTSSTSR
eukprot:CAMPEP_0115860852 /NCGR_PEP_ID=MMETSP0287-20121206/17345_1 /TAXON_ID=412157 /ORGANISM="Chrysochromulina rotalis, Strain UIO044" /LENGTH=142 /DNA_ID=CAMNT_0003315197 /DNA_START=193 /DNA_END=622 /DNA_ORIENTATION=+